MTGQDYPARRRREILLHAVEHAAHLLPAQGPIGVFIHHNTLHAFENLPFERAVVEASQLFGTEPYMSEAAYRKDLARGRVHIDDINAVLESEPEAVVFPGLTRRSLRRAMIMPGVREFDGATILWRTEQGDLARDFHQPALRALFDACFKRTIAHEAEPPASRPIDEVIHPWLIRLCSVFLDQGSAYWPMPYRERGFYESVRTLLGRRGGVFPRYLRGLDKEFRRQEQSSFSATDVVLDFLVAENVPESEWQEILQSELLALPGWAGLMRKLEESPGLAPHESIPCSLMDFLAVRLTMSRVAARMGAAEIVPRENPLKTQERLRLSRTARIYDAARVLSFSASEVNLLSDADWASFVNEIKACNGLERRRILHLAYERSHESSILHGLASHRKYRGLTCLKDRPRTQVFFCLDEREESMRRALEELDPEVKTFGAGYFGVAVDYQGIDDPQGAAFCPVVVKPRHAVIEQPKAEDAALHKRPLAQTSAGTADAEFICLFAVAGSRLAVDDGARTAFGGALDRPSAGATPVRHPARLAQHGLSSRAAHRAAVHAQRRGVTARDRGLVDGVCGGGKGESVASVLGPAGLKQGFARLVVLLGHGSTSLNNPHESAHDCGACGGRRGGPNARLFAAMANRPEVRLLLRGRGIDVPEDTWFIGGYHDTCSDDVELFDLDTVPATHHRDLELIRKSLDEARARDAHERTRRFESCPAGADPAEALIHVEERSEHLAQPRPE